MVIWVVESYLHSTVPTVKKYAGVEVRKTGVKVRVRGTEKYIPNAVSRRFFTDEKTLKGYLRKWLERKLDLLKAEVEKVEAALAGKGVVYDEVRADVLPLIPKLRLRADDGEPPERHIDL